MTQLDHLKYVQSSYILHFVELSSNIFYVHCENTTILYFPHSVLELLLLCFSQTLVLIWQ
jgi:hypothetical protein